MKARKSRIRTTIEMPMKVSWRERICWREGRPPPPPPPRAGTGSSSKPRDVRGSRATPGTGGRASPRPLCRRSGSAGSSAGSSGTPPRPPNPECGGSPGWAGRSSEHRLRRRRSPRRLSGALSPQRLLPLHPSDRAVRLCSSSLSRPSQVQERAPAAAKPGTWSKASGFWGVSRSASGSAGAATAPFTVPGTSGSAATSPSRPSRGRRRAGAARGARRRAPQPPRDRHPLRARQRARRHLPGQRARRRAEPPRARRRRARSATATSPRSAPRSAARSPTPTHRASSTAT